MLDVWPLDAVNPRKLNCKDLACRLIAAAAFLPAWTLPPPAKQVLADLFDDAASDGSFGKPPRKPTTYSRLCVAIPERTGKGRCGHVKPGEYRIHTKGRMGC